MKRWSIVEVKRVIDTEVDEYLEEVIELGRRRGFILAHEDGHGAFLVARRAEIDGEQLGRTEEWLREANLADGKSIL